MKSQETRVLMIPHHIYVLLLNDNRYYYVSTFTFSTMEVEWIDGTVICLDGELDVSIGSNVDHKHFFQSQ